MMGFKLEWLKWSRSKRGWSAALVLVFYLFLMLLGFYTYAQKETGGQAEFRYTFENANYFNGLTFALYGFYFAALMVLPIFAAAEGGAQLARETHQRTLHLLFFAPISRSRIFLTKLLVSFVCQSIITGFLLVLALLLGLVLVGWGDLNIYPGVLQMTETHQHLSQAQAMRAFFAAWLAASLAMTAPLGLGYFLATFLKNPINAVAVTVAVYLVMLVVSEVHFFRDLRPYLFTTYMGYWRELFREAINWRQIAVDGAKLLAYGMGMVTLAHWRFRRQEAL